ncbi:MAG: hypothetical protein IJG61_07255 [Lachnospiraceae bacterium]|nr:hypothetical protein [Lachnospiraceae bacterium]
MSQVIPFPNERSPSRCGTDGVPETFGPPRDFGWLLYSIIEIEIAQASLANAISRLPPDPPNTVQAVSEKVMMPASSRAMPGRSARLRAAWVWEWFLCFFIYAFLFIYFKFLYLKIFISVY